MICHIQHTNVISIEIVNDIMSSMLTGHSDIHIIHILYISHTKCIVYVSDLASESSMDIYLKVSFATLYQWHIEGGSGITMSQPLHIKFSSVQLCNSHPANLLQRWNCPKFLIIINYYFTIGQALMVECLLDVYNALWCDVKKDVILWHSNCMAILWTL